MTAPAPTLQPTDFFDFEHPRVAAFVDETLPDLDTLDPITRATRLYVAVRDGIRYNPYVFDKKDGSFRASDVLESGRSYCIPKAVLLGAACRAVGIPSRLGLANVKNHIASPQLIEHLRTEVFAMHGYIELFLEGKWVKATPAFDADLCARLDVAPLDFDGREDSIFHEFTNDGQRHMEYLVHHGTFADVPVDAIIAELHKHYPHLFGPDGIPETQRRVSLQADLDEAG